MPRLDPALAVLLLSVVLAYAYAFVGGFADAANAIATAVGTRAFTPLHAAAGGGSRAPGGAHRYGRGLDHRSRYRPAAGDGEEALAESRRALPAAVLTDLQMLRMDGVELCRRLHELDPALPVIIMTAHTDMQPVIDSLRAGAEDYLVKPLLYDAVVWCVQGSEFWVDLPRCGASAPGEL